VVLSYLLEEVVSIHLYMYRCRGHDINGQYVVNIVEMFTNFTISCFRQT